jgi:hypothetical protein
VVFSQFIHKLIEIMAVTFTIFFAEVRELGADGAALYIVPRASTGFAQAAHRGEHLER